MIKLLDFEVNGIYGRMGENSKVHTKETPENVTDYLGLYPETMIKTRLNVDQFRELMKRRKEMNKEQFDKLYAGENTVVYCATEDLAKEFLSLAHNLGYKWRTGKSLKHTTHFANNRVYYLGEVSENTVTYGTKVGLDNINIVEYLGKDPRSKFKLNDKVTISDKSMFHSRFKGEVFTIEDIKKEFSFRHIYKLEGIDGAFREFELDLAPEDTVIHKFETKELGEVELQDNRIIGKLKIIKNTNDKIKSWLKLFEDIADTGVWTHTVNRIIHLAQSIEGLEVVDEETYKLYMIHRGALEFTFEVTRQWGFIRIENVVHNGKDIEL